MKRPELTKRIGPEPEDVMITTEREQLLHALTDREFDALLDMPFLSEEMSDHYLNCEACGARLERLMHRDFAALSQKDQQEMDQRFPEHSAGSREARKADREATVVAPSVSSLNQGKRSVFGQCLDGAKRRVEWATNAAGELCRSVGVPTGGLVPKFVGQVVQGEPTRTYERNLMNLLEELGVADEFETFKLLCETGSGTTVSATLVPKKTDNEEGRIEVFLYLSQADPPAARRRRPSGDSPRRLPPLHLIPYSDETSTQKFSFNEMGDPTKFEGKLEIRIREAE